MAMFLNKLSVETEGPGGTSEVAGAVVGPVIVIVPPPFVSIVAPGSRMKVSLRRVAREIEEPPLRVSVPDMKYDPAGNR